MKKLECFIKDEKGVSLIEILAAIVILSLALVLLSTFMYQNFAAIEQNKKKEEAIYVREDIKSWLEYRAQSQDVANLNQVVGSYTRNTDKLFAIIYKRSFYYADKKHSYKIFKRV